MQHTFFLNIWHPGFLIPNCLYFCLQSLSQYFCCCCSVHKRRMCLSWFEVSFFFFFFRFIVFFFNALRRDWSFFFCFFCLFVFLFLNQTHLRVNLMVGWFGWGSRGEGVVTSGNSSLHNLCKRWRWKDKINYLNTKNMKGKKKKSNIAITKNRKVREGH